MGKSYFSRRTITFLVIAIIAILGFFFYQNSNQNTSYSCQDCNVVFISIDSLRYDHLSAYGYYRNTTPNIDSLAKQGILFENQFSNAYLTMVSQLTIFTGLYPSTHGLSYPSIFLQNGDMIANPSDYPNFRMNSNANAT